jgi:hypothetical protein
MAILNENLNWQDFANPDLQRAFQRTPEKCLLPVDQLLCRFITAESQKHGTRGNEIFLSPWWSDWNKTAGMIGQWSSQGASARNVIRAKLAITQRFSEKLDGLVQIVLTKPVYCWKGPARHQEDKLQKVTYLGGGEQYFLPNLASDKQGLSSNVAHMHSWSWVDSLV